MASIEQLERKILELERQVTATLEKTSQMQRSSEKALDKAMHAYQLDGYGYIWVYNPETQTYHKTNQRVMTPEVADRAVMAKNIADNAIEGRHIADDVIEGRMIKQKTIEGRSIQSGVIGADQIKDGSITGDNMTPGSLPNGKLADDAVSCRNIQPRAVTACKLGCDVVPKVVKPEIDKAVEDLQNQIDALDEHGVAVSNEFGSDPHIGISQKTLTDAINKIWQKIEDITGEILQGINMVVTPTYFISEGGCDIHISANTVDTNGIFERIAFFVDGEKIFESVDAHYVGPFVYHLDNKDTYDYVVMCKAKILGIEYTRQQIVTRYNEFYIGAGSTYNDVMDSAHARQLNGTMRHNYDITFNESDKLIIVMGASLRGGFVRADLNGMEIQMTEETVTIDDKEYVVLTSEPWNAGDYNIDING